MGGLNDRGTTLRSDAFSSCLALRLVGEPGMPAQINRRGDPSGVSTARRFFGGGVYNGTSRLDLEMTARSGDAGGVRSRERELDEATVDAKTAPRVDDDSLRLLVTLV